MIKRPAGLLVFFILGMPRLEVAKGCLVLPEIAGKYSELQLQVIEKSDPGIFILIMVQGLCQVAVRFFLSSAGLFRKPRLYRAIKFW